MRSLLRGYFAACSVSIIQLKICQSKNTNRKNAAGFILMFPEQMAFLLQAGTYLLSCFFPFAKVEIKHFLSTTSKNIVETAQLSLALCFQFLFGSNQRNAPLHIAHHPTNTFPASKSRVKFSSGISSVLTTFHHIPFHLHSYYHQCWKIPDTTAGAQCPLLLKSAAENSSFVAFRNTN